MKKLFFENKKFLLIGTILFFLGLVCLSLSTRGILAEERVPLRAEDAEKTISMDFKDANLKDVLKVFSQQSGLNFVASDKIEDKKITLYFKDVEVQDALDRILDAHNLTYKYSKDSDIFLVEPTGKEELPTVTRIYNLNYATLEKATAAGTAETGDGGIKSIIEKLLSKQGTIMADTRTNSLIVRDIPAQFPLIERTIAKLDTQTLQVMIEAEVLETTVNLAERLGTGMTFMGDKGSYMDFSTNYHDSGYTFYGVLNHTEFAGLLDMLESQGKLKYLARPRVLSLNNETAQIDIATWETIGVDLQTTTEGTLSVESGEREWVGTKLKVTPHINKEGFIVMEVEPEVSRTFDTKLSGYEGKFRDVFKKSAKAKVMVKDGETLVIGGLTTGQEEESRRQVPFLGNIPILGWLFKGREASEQKGELVIFVTPRIIRKGAYEGAEIAQRRKIMRESSESYDTSAKVRREDLRQTEVEVEEEMRRSEPERPKEPRSREEEIDWVLDQMSEE